MDNYTYFGVYMIIYTVDYWVIGLVVGVSPKGIPNGFWRILGFGIGFDLCE